MTMDLQENVPRTAFVVDLGDAPTQRADVARLHHLVGLFHSHRVAATWAVGNVERAALFSQVSQGRFAAHTDVLALSLSPRRATEQTTSNPLRGRWARQWVDFNAFSDRGIEIVLGDLRVLRRHAKFLSERGVRAIVSTSQPSGSAVAPRSWPLGIWQFTPGLWIPQPSRLSRLLFSRVATAKQWIARPGESATVVAIDSAQLGQRSPRKLRQLEHFVRDVAWAVSRGQLGLTTIGQLASELTSAAELQPQRSILRVAA